MFLNLLLQYLTIVGGGGNPGEKRVRKRLKPTQESIQCKAQLKAVWENGFVVLCRVDLSCNHLDSLEDAD